MNELERDIDEFLAGLGFELVALERGGGRGKPLLRLRIDHRFGEAPVQQSGVSVEDCARVSRSLSDWLESRTDVPGDYVLEVSSPGVERPLIRRRDYRRFTGRQVRVKGYAPLAGVSKKLEGELLGLAGDDDSGDDEHVEVELEVGGECLRIPLSAIAKATLVYDFEQDL